MADRLALAAAVCFFGSCTAPVAPTSEPPAPSPPKSAAATTATATPAVTAQPDSGEACPHAEGEDARVFDYDAFGPAAMSSSLLGQAWWQWDSEGHAFERDGGTIWVVVHDGLNGDALATRFPVRQDEFCDHRYVALPDARAHLRTHIDELADPSVPELAPLRAELQQTLKTLDAHFD